MQVIPYLSFAESSSTSLLAVRERMLRCMFTSELGSLPQFKPISLRHTSQDFLPTVLHHTGTASLLFWHPLLRCDAVHRPAALSSAGGILLMSLDCSDRLCSPAGVVCLNSGSLRLQRRIVKVLLS